MKIADVRSIVYYHTNFFRVDVSVTPEGLLVITGYDGKGGERDLLKYGIKARKAYIGRLSAIGLDKHEDELQKLI